MDWNAVSAVAEIIGVVLVAVSVIYIAVQVKSGTQATHSQTYHLATSALAELAAIIGSDRGLIRIFRVGLADRAVSSRTSSVNSTTCCSACSAASRTSSSSMSPA